MDVELQTIVECGARTQVVRILYKKPGERHSPWRRVEPYKIVESGDSLMVRCFQLHRGDSIDEGWRHFRVDRIEDAEPDEACIFQARSAITLDSGLVHQFFSTRRMTRPGAEYLRFLQTALADGRITDDERHGAEELAVGLQPAEMKVAHARVFSELIDELLLDGRLSFEEEKYLASVRNFLDALGWSP